MVKFITHKKWIRHRNIENGFPSVQGLQLLDTQPFIFTDYALYYPIWLLSILSTTLYSCYLI